MKVLPVNMWPVVTSGLVLLFAVGLMLHGDTWDRLNEMPCLLRNNYVLMEATRPLTECHTCTDIDGPIVLHNPTRQQFAKIAYSSTPVLVKGAAKKWPALKTFSYEFFAELYDSIAGAYQSVEDECQFLPFKTNFLSLQEAFHMNTERAQLKSAQPWYIGWSNCHPKVRQILRSYYQHPEFLPADSESSALDWIFMGAPGPATTMHLDYVLRPSWQAQISGRKLWQLLPPPECEAFCKGFNITVETGDIVFIDTNQWYHNTCILPEGGLSISIGSEYD